MSTNILARAKLTWNETGAGEPRERDDLREKRDGFMTRWSCLVRSRTEDELRRQRDSLRDSHAGQPYILGYLEN